MRSSFQGVRHTKLIIMSVSNDYEYGYNDSYVFEDKKDYFVEIVTLFIEIIGIIGNALVIFIILYYKKMHNVPNYLILSVAIGDLLFMVFSAPFTVISLGFPSAAGNEVVCKLTNFILILSQGVSALSFTALSADRYFAINMAVAPMRDYAKRVTYFSIIVSWTTSLSFALPVLWFSTVYILPFGANMYVCSFAPDDAWKHATVVYQTCRFVFLYALPVIVISVLYTLVAMELFRSIREMPTESTRSTSKSASASKNQAQARKRLAITVLVLAVMYTFCWLPYMFKEIAVEISDKIHFNSNYKNVSFIMLYLSSCINPFALVAMSRNYRKYFLRLLLCGKVQGRRKKPHPNTITSYSYNSVMSKPPHCNNEIETVIEEPEV
ncbi:bombesin receptor subtype-3-like [Anneissia japonica]|uniref:bombesin receptor subtype-3-like n=1 Tax=Anneissia japonica TaxID=1529436 RepID=UPI0014255CCD|nr:bombesin receptor subtype-3-like [Anneissia japonica]XP_033107755.1 bombesin receptor subtype-3-like [Anneissia japonica]XP_033107756.1 bombesin receptor subtype-3-like [Anneissia japonica]